MFWSTERKLEYVISVSRIVPGVLQLTMCFVYQACQQLSKVNWYYIRSEPCLFLELLKKNQSYRRINRDCFTDVDIMIRKHFTILVLSLCIRCFSVYDVILYGVPVTTFGRDDGLVQEMFTDFLSSGCPSGFICVLVQCYGTKL